MRIRILCLALGLIFSLSNYAQRAPGKYWVQFANKAGTPYNTAQPEFFLSEKSIYKRAQLGISIGEDDLPVNPDYINGVMVLGNVRLLNRSKWMNSITVQLLDTTLYEDWLNALSTLPYVLSVRRVDGALQTEPKDTWRGQDDVLPLANKSGLLDTTKYGPSFHQIAMINGHVLHELGYEGQGIDIALLDGGWIGTNTLPAFAHLYEDGRLKGVRDFVSPGSDSVYFKSAHGTFVLAHMAGILPDSLYGTAPKANYYLFRTEDVDTEYLIEEDNWLAAAEYCDSLGVDIINSSLGYSRFDDVSQDHSYEDMDGNTTVVTRAADMAAAKGILVVNSAGNSGANSWRYITAPSDGDSVLCVGAVNASRQHAPFSSFGPSADGDVKPNVCAMGQQTVFADLDGTIRRGNGTSFSSPIMAGAAACLWQAFPFLTPIDLLRRIEQSASLYQMPNDSLGNGIPDMWKAFQQLADGRVASGDSDQLNVFPNPANERITFSWNADSTTEETKYRIIDAVGRVVFSSNQWCAARLQGYYEVSLNITTFAPGLYFFQTESDGETQVARFQKY